MLGKRMRALRKMRKIGLEEFANAIGVSKQSLSNWENGNIIPSVEKLVLIADFFQVTTDFLLGRNIDKQASPQTLNVTGLTPSQVEHLQYLVEDLLGSER
ncbi:MAG: helix-turn-helix transcriptional regulator [Oscillibacter sp.]|nr:helix-turn-helix transcriptional regulator [Oscillibacter sp.]